MEHNDLAELIDRLPQPYRSIDNTIKKILLNVDNAVERIESEREELISKGKLRKATPKCQRSNYFTKLDIVIPSHELKNLIAKEPEQKSQSTAKKDVKKPPPKQPTKKEEEPPLTPSVMIPEYVDDISFNGERAFAISGTGILSVIDTSEFVSDQINDSNSKIITFKKVLVTLPDFPPTKEEEVKKPAPKSRATSPATKTSQTPSVRQQTAMKPKQEDLSLKYLVRAIKLFDATTKNPKIYAVAVACKQKTLVQLYFYFDYAKNTEEKTEDKEKLRLISDINMGASIAKYVATVTDVPSFMIHDIYMRDDLRYLTVCLALCAINASAVLYKFSEWNLTQLLELPKQYDAECALVVETATTKFSGQSHNTHNCRVVFITNSELAREMGEMNQLLLVSKVSEPTQKKLVVRDMLVWWPGTNILVRYKLAEGDSYVRKDWTFSDAVTALDIEPLNNQLYCTGLSNGNLTLWQTRTGTTLCFLEPHERKVESVSFYKDKFLITSDASRIVHCYDLSKNKDQKETYKVHYRLRYYETEPTIDKLLVAQGLPIMIVATDRFIDAYDLVTGVLLCAIRDNRFASGGPNAKPLLMNAETVVLVDDTLSTFEVYRFIDLILSAYPQLKESPSDVTQEINPLILSFVASNTHVDKRAQTAKQLLSHQQRSYPHELIRGTTPHGTVLTLSTLRDRKNETQRSGTAESTQSLRVLRTKQLIENTRTERKQRLSNTLPKPTTAVGLQKK
jgi:hypothetical protein